jgi:hypothetical protein
MEKGMELANKHKIDFVEISAKDTKVLDDLVMRGCKYIH